MRNCGKVYLVGAGCGEYDLITLRGMNILKKCEVLVYDSLIDINLIDFAPEDSEKICVGKRSGHHSESQENINRLLVEKALDSKIVVRLKGGDPFVFGRGGEEITELKKHDIPYSVIPAVSSCIAVPELVGIPVTHRKLCRSFHVITGHPIPGNLEYYAKSEGTLVFLMGLKNLRKIAEGLIDGGMSGDTPSAVISGKRKVTDTLENIADMAERENIPAPAVIVIGKTAEFDFSPTLKNPLENVSVTVTGTERFTGKLFSEFSALGAYVKRINTLKISEYENNQYFDKALQNIKKYSLIILTSINGAEIFFRRMKRLKIDIRQLGNIKFAVIGKNTSDFLAERGIYADIVPEIYTSSELAKAVVKSNPDNVLILRAEKGSEILTDILDENNIIYDDIKIYDTEFQTDKLYIYTDYIIFGSSSGAKEFFENQCSLSDKTKIVCIGKTTAKAVPENIKNTVLTAETYDIQGIVNTILKEENKK